MGSTNSIASLGGFCFVYVVFNILETKEYRCINNKPYFSSRISKFITAQVFEHLWYDKYSIACCEAWKLGSHYINISVVMGFYLKQK